MNGKVWAPRELGHEARDVRRRKARSPGGSQDSTTVAAAPGLGFSGLLGGGVQKPSREEQGGTMFGLSLATPQQKARLEEDQGVLINGSRGKCHLGGGRAGQCLTRGEIIWESLASFARICLESV